MKKTLSAISALAVMIGLSTSCQKELAGGQEPAGNKPFTITASIADGGTKVSYAEDGTPPALKPSWEVNDVIIGFDGAGNTYGYSVTEVNNETKKATLEIIASGANAGNKTVNPADGTKMYMFYAPGKTPANISDKSLTVSLASQDKDVVPALMMASAEVTNSSLSLEFQNKTAIIGVKTPVMAAAGKAYTSLALSGSVGLNTSVKFDLNGETLQASYQTAGTITKALDFTSDASTKQGPDVIYIVACPAAAQDLTFTFNENEEYFKVTGATMEPGNYYYMTPTTGKRKFSITVDGSIANGSISTDKTEGTCAWGETVTVTATPATGYELATLTYSYAGSSDNDITSAKSFTMPKANVTVSGTFTPISYTLTGTPSPTEGGSVTFTKGGTTATVAYFGDEITIVNTASDDYVFSSVSAVDASSNPVTITGNTFTMPASNVTVTTTFAKKSFGITKTDVAVTGGSFKVKKGDDEVTSAQWDETIKVEVTKPQYYAVDEIKVYKTGELSTTVTVNADGTFTMPKHAVTIEVTFTPDGSAPPTEMPETIGL